MMSESELLQCELLCFPPGGKTCHNSGHYGVLPGGCFIKRLTAEIRRLKAQLEEKDERVLS